MPIARRGTPPTSRNKEQLSLFNSLSAWTDPEETEEKRRTPKDDNGYRELGSDAHSSAPRQRSFGTRCASLLDVEGDYFNMLIGTVIIGNAFVIGLETDLGRSQFAPFEHAFNAVFLLEALLRLSQLGRAYFTELWNLFDCMLVIVGSLDLWILPLLTLDGVQGEMGYKLTVIRMLRVLRLLRVLRVIRLFRMFHQLNLILQAFNKAFQMVMLISLLVFILDYVCAIVLTQAVGQHASDYGDDAAFIDMSFGTISRSMQTLFLIMTLSDWQKVPETLAGELPSVLVSIVFVLYIMVTSYTMASLITGIISESLITSQQEYIRRRRQRVEEKRHELEADLRDFLWAVNEELCDNYGCVDHNDLKQSLRGDPELLGKLAAIGICLDEKGILELVDNLSQDGLVRVNIDHFIDKVTNLLGPASAGLVVDLKAEVAKSMQVMSNIEKKLEMLCSRVSPSSSESPKKEVPEPLPAPPAPVTTPTSGRSSLRKDGQGPLLADRPAVKKITFEIPP